MSDRERLSGLSVLVLEDDFYLADDARQTLESAGASVLGPFARAAEAQAMLERSKPDCALIDVNLGGGPNFDAARALLDSGVPIVFVTGYDRDVIPPDLAHVPCLQKPTQPKKMVEAVKAVSER